MREVTSIVIQNQPYHKNNAKLFETASDRFSYVDSSVDTNRGSLSIVNMDHSIV